MSAESGRRPVLATLTAAQVPVLGAIPALRGLTAGIDSALHLAVYHADADVDAFAAYLRTVRSSDLFDADFSRAFASGYTLTATELRRIGGTR